MGEMQTKTDLQLIESLRILVAVTGRNMSAPDRAIRILDEMQARAERKQ